MVICDKSYNKFCTSNCSGNIGRNGKKALAPNTVRTLPKLELAAILTYLTMFAEFLRPSITTSAMAVRLFSNMTMSAHSLATSTAVSTEIPTSAERRAAASLMPSPKNPTVLPSAFRAEITRAFCNGVTLTKRVVAETTLRSSVSVIDSTSLPSIACSTFRSTHLQMRRVTNSLSPVKILTAIPRFWSAAKAAAVDSLGGSRNATKPASTRSASSFARYW